MPPRIIEVIVLGKDQASSVISGVGSAVSGLGGIAAGVATGGLALAAAAVVGLGAAAVGATVGITKLAMAAADVEGTRQTFQRLGGDLDSLKEATRGMVNEADLMAASNKLMTMGIGETTEEVADLSEMATQLGLAMNEDATASMENFALMMANQSIPRLDSFGISSAAVRERMKELTATTEASGISQAGWDEKVGKATQRIEDLKGKLHLAGLKQAEWTDKTKESTRVAHAQRIDKITRQIAEQETELSELMNTTVGMTEASEAMSREEAFKIAVLEQGAIAMEKVGEQGDSATATTLRWKAAIEDLKLGIGQAFIPALEAIRKPALDLVERYGPKIIEWANLAGEWFAEKIPLAIAVLEEKWNEYWPTAQAVLIGFWEVIQPKLFRLKVFLFEDIPNAIAKLRGLWLEYWPMAKSAVLDFWDRIKPGIMWVREWLSEHVPAAIERLRTLWAGFWPEASGTLTGFWDKIKPGLEWVRDIFQSYYETYLPRLRDAWDILKEGWDAITELYNTLLKPALEDLWAALQPLWETMGTGEDKSNAIAGALGTFQGIMLQIYASGIIGLIKAGIVVLTIGIEAFVWILEKARHWTIVFRDALQGTLWVFNEIRHWISVLVEKFDHFKSTLAGFSLPWWLTPGSPTPLETGLVGIGKALADVQGLATGGIAFGGMTLASAGAGVGGGGGVTTISIVNHFGPDSVRTDEDILDISDAITQELELRGIGPVL